MLGHWSQEKNVTYLVAVLSRSVHIITIYNEGEVAIQGPSQGWSYQQSKSQHNQHDHTESVRRSDLTLKCSFIYTHRFCE